MNLNLNKLGQLCIALINLTDIIILIPTAQVMLMLVAPTGVMKSSKAKQG